MIDKLPRELQEKIYMYALPSIHCSYPTFHQELIEEKNKRNQFFYRVQRAKQYARFKIKQYQKEKLKQYQKEKLKQYTM